MGFSPRGKAFLVYTFSESALEPAPFFGRFHTGVETPASLRIDRAKLE